MCVVVFAPCCSKAAVKSSTTASSGHGVAGASPNSVSSSSAFALLTSVMAVTACLGGSFCSSTCSDAFTTSGVLAASSGAVILAGSSSCFTSSSSLTCASVVRWRFASCTPSADGAPSSASSQSRLAPSAAGLFSARGLPSASARGPSSLASALRSLWQYLSAFFASGSLTRTKPSIRANSGFACTARPLAASGSGGMYTCTASGSRCRRFWWKDSRWRRSNACRRKRCDCTATFSPVKSPQSVL
mmetsp:Transcript_18783/g.51754  ORF Transcript_18783/g.51754 Transcript_18783/m.51754 type:complete len:245 (-) Transcript_18783:1393-2127(-)